MTEQDAAADQIERYKITHSAEVERLLRNLIDKKALVTAYSDNNRDFLVTTLVDLDVDARAMYLGGGSERATDDALIASKTVTYNTAHEQIRILFSTPGMKRIVRDGQSLLMAPIPSEVLRFQRREYFRLPTPMLNPARCTIPLEGGGTMTTTVIDISVGGVGVIAFEGEGDIRSGAVYSGCRLSLPNSGTYTVGLSVRGVYDHVLRSGSVSHRAGCQFINLMPGVETDIQRYIIRVERERRLNNA